MDVLGHKQFGWVSFKLPIPANPDQFQVAVDTELAEAILQAGSAVHIIATSREPLQSEGEWTYVVPPLTAPAAADENLCQCSAARLFAIRARAGGAHIISDQEIASS